MKKIYPVSLAIASLFAATPVWAANPYSGAEMVGFAQAAYDSTKNNPGLSLSTAGFLYLVQNPSTTASWTTTLSGFLQTSSACSGTHPGVSPACSSALATQIRSMGVAGTEAQLGAVSIAGALALQRIQSDHPLDAYFPGAQPQAAAPVAVPPSTPGTAPQTLAQALTQQIQRATSIQQASIISEAVSSRSPSAARSPNRVAFSGERGMAAGNASPKLNAWVNAAESKIGNSATATLFDGKVTNAIGGVDYMLSGDLVAGISLGLDRVAVDFKLSGLTNSGLVSNGWMIAPYASYQINDMISVDGALGYAKGDVDTRTNGVSDKRGYSRDFVALNLTATQWMKDLQITGKLNFISANEKVATTNKMEQIRLGGQVGYWMDSVMPYASLTYVRDLKVSTGGVTPATSPDKEAWVAAIGANLFSKGAIYGGAAYTEEFGRTDSKNKTFMFNVGYRF